MQPSRVHIGRKLDQKQGLDPIQVTPTKDAGMASGGLTSCTTVPAPHYHEFLSTSSEGSFDTVAPSGILNAPIWGAFLSLVLLLS